MPQLSCMRNAELHEVDVAERLAALGWHRTPGEIDIL